MELAFYSSEGWESWGLSGKPTIPEGMAFLVDDDLLFEDGRGLRATAVANEWLRLRPTENCPAPSSWGTYARILRDWIAAAQLHEIEVFDTRDRLKALLSTYAVDRATGAPKRRLGAVTWNQHMSVLGMFYRWAMAEQHAACPPPAPERPRTDPAAEPDVYQRFEREPVGETPLFIHLGFNYTWAPPSWQRELVRPGFRIRCGSG